MSRTPPGYFEAIRIGAEKRWHTLEDDPDIAGPWRLLFKQVQSPRHVLSELMQNADDVGAKQAVVSLEEGIFSFMHDGEDFTKEHFQSLCRFGYSNKREMHTIGFRGIGFKSIFSLGNEVQLLTPTLAVTFKAARFTLPEWNNEIPRRTGWTEIRIRISDRLRFDELKKNLDEWLKTGFSLLFFRNIRSLKIGSREITWVERAKGPIPDSQWMTVKGTGTSGYLLARSSKMDFPPECQDEIQRERQVYDSDHISMPPCTVEIVAGGAGRLHVIVPTNIETKLPFTTNAPFVQDPARIKIKELELSPTNRWLLEQVGILAAQLILDWICRSSSAADKRVQAYSLLAYCEEEDLDDLPTRVLRTVDQVMVRHLDGRDFILDVQGVPRPAGSCFMVDAGIQGIWPTAIIASAFGPPGGHLMHQAVRDKDRIILAKKGYVQNVNREAILDKLQKAKVPKPSSFDNLLQMWCYLSTDLSSSKHSKIRSRVHILPVLNDVNLAQPEGTLRVNRPEELKNPADWEFFGKHLPILDNAWVDYLHEKFTDADAGGNSVRPEQKEEALKLLDILGLGNHVGVKKIIGRMANKLAEEPRGKLENCVRLTQIAAGLQMDLPDDFPFFNRGGGTHFSRNLVNDADGFVAEHSPKQWAESLCLHASYAMNNPSCTVKEWQDWLIGPNAHLLAFPLPEKTKKRKLSSRKEIEDFLKVRGYYGDIEMHYSRQNYEVTDWDYPTETWDFWDECAEVKPDFWKQWMLHFLALSPNVLLSCGRIKAEQVCNFMKSKEIVADKKILPAWAIQLRQRKCLPNEYGQLEYPQNLLVQTDENKIFQGKLPFVQLLLDKETNRPILQMIGAKLYCDDPSYFLNCLRALAKASEPPIAEVARQYEMLDVSWQHLGSLQQTVVKAFAEERLILNSDCKWITSLDSGAWLGTHPNSIPEPRKLDFWKYLEKPDIKDSKSNDHKKELEIKKLIQANWHSPISNVQHGGGPVLVGQFLQPELLFKIESQELMQIGVNQIEQSSTKKTDQINDHDKGIESEKPIQIDSPLPTENLRPSENPPLLDLDQFLQTELRLKIEPQELLRIGVDQIERSTIQKVDRGDPVATKQQAVPEQLHRNLPDWVHELIPVGAVFERLSWQDESCTVRLLDSDGKELFGKWISAKG